MEPVPRDGAHFLDRFQRSFGQGPTATGEEASSGWAPAIEISETDKEYLLRAELPGIPRDDVRISVDEGVLTLSGERRTEKETQGQTVHRSERCYGCFARSFTLPPDVQADRIDADYKDGILSVHLPREPARRPKPIEIKVH